jgi:hypothetical protein
MIGRTATGLTITPLGCPTHKARNWMICARPRPSRPGCLTHRVGDLISYQKNGKYCVVTVRRTLTPPTEP